MKIILAYGTVLFIWATTPLGIKFSNSSLSFSAAITLRMVLALLCCAGLLVVLRRPLVTQRRDWWAFLAGAAGLFPNMLIIYWSAQYISSGLISVLLGFFPFFVGIFSWLLLREKILTGTKLLALMIAVVGLWCIHRDQVALSERGVWGVLGMLLVAAIWGASSVWVKALGVTIDPIRQSTGTLVIAAPCFVIYWFLFDGHWPVAVDAKSYWGVVYLVVAGSLIGHTLYFFVLRECSMAAASVLTLMTPILAIFLGYGVLHERLHGGELWGVGLIIISLGFYLGIFARVLDFWRHRQFAAAKSSAP